MKRPLALAGALAVLAVGTVTAATPAAAAARHVGVVVRYGDGRVSAGCATVGGTGLAVLQQHHDVQLGTQQYSGFVLEVDNVGTTHPDDTHYWSYWHSGGQGGWTYASSGSASYRPKAGTVEGWSYVDGQGSAPRPPSRTYAALCGHLDPHATPHPTPTPTHATSSTAAAPPTTASATSTGARPVPRTTAVAPVHRPRSAARTAAPAAPAAPASTGTTASTPSATRSKAVGSTATPDRRRASSTAPRHASSTAGSSAAPSPAASSSPAAPTLAAQPAADTSTTSAWPAVGALAVVAALGVTAWLVMRRRAG